MTEEEEETKRYEQSIYDIGFEDGYQDADTGIAKIQKTVDYADETRFNDHSIMIRQLAKMRKDMTIIVAGVAINTGVLVWALVSRF